MKKADLKKLKEIISTLPNIPVLEGGQAKFTQVLKSGGLMRTQGVETDEKGQPIRTDYSYKTAEPEKGNFVNKLKFFTDHLEKGFSMQQTIDLWNEKFKKVMELIANYTPPPKKEETTEEMKQRVADECEKAELRKISKRSVCLPRRKKK